MKITETAIAGVLLVEPQVFRDARGYFMESYNAERFARETGLDLRFVQDNESRSVYGVIRGLHYQLPPFAQAKLVRVVQGAVWDVVVDLRRGSPTFGRHVAMELSATNHRQLFIPAGCAHGYAVLSEEALFQYKCDCGYHPEAEAGIAWDDPSLAIAWPIPKGRELLSEKDLRHPAFSEAVYFES